MQSAYHAFWYLSKCGRTPQFLSLRSKIARRGKRSATKKDSRSCPFFRLARFADHSVSRVSWSVDHREQVKLLFSVSERFAVSLSRLFCIFSARKFFCDRFFLAVPPSHQTKYFGFRFAVRKDSCSQYLQPVARFHSNASSAKVSPFFGFTVSFLCRFDVRYLSKKNVWLDATS